MTTTYTIPVASGDVGPFATREAAEASRVVLEPLLGMDLAVRVVSALDFDGTPLVREHPMSAYVIRAKPSRVRKPTAPRTCCPTHRDTCNFGRQHVWGIGFYQGDGTWSLPGDAKCSTCGGICTAERAA